MGHNKMAANGEQCLNCLSQPRGQPQRLPDVVGGGVQGNLKDVQAGKCNRPAFEFHDQLRQMAFSLEMQVGEGRYTLFNGRRLVTCSLFPLDALYGGGNPEPIYLTL